MNHSFKNKTTNSPKKLRHQWLMGILILIPWVIIVGVINVIISLLANISYTPATSEQTSIEFLYIGIATLIGTITTVAIFTRWIEKRSFLDIGLRIEGKSTDIIIGLIAGALCMLTGYIILIGTGQIEYIRTSFVLKNLTLSFVYYIIISLSEEILIRGYILRSFMGSFNKYIALILATTLFMISHLWNPNISYLGMVNVFLAGISLGITYIYTKNLWFPIALHFSWNFFQSLFGFNVSGMNDYSMIECHIPNANIINGGAFGFEGSILATIFQLILITCLVFYHKKD